MEERTIMEASCTNNMHAGEKVFCSCYFRRFAGFFVGRVKKTCSIVGLYESLISAEEKTE